ncbi:hypothetical protein GCM10027614_35290 [Micromonospora vulcania]
MSSERLAGLLDEYAELEKRLADPAIHADQATARRVGRRYAELVPLHKAAGELEQARADLTAARELAAEDPPSPPRRSRSGRPCRPWRSASPSCSSRVTRTTPRT